MTVTPCSGQRGHWEGIFSGGLVFSWSQAQETGLSAALFGRTGVTSWGRGSLPSLAESEGRSNSLLINAYF